MNCELCGNVIGETTVLLPIRQPDGRLDAFACLACSEQSGRYCSKHQRPHLGFDDDTTACKECIDEQVVAEGEKIAGIFSGRISTSERFEEIYRDIKGWLALVDESLRHVSLGDLPLAMQYRQTPQSLNISRAIITRSQRMKITPEEVIEEVANKGAKIILPPLFGQ